VVEKAAPDGKKSKREGNKALKILKKSLDAEAGSQ
jgi:hypothetical protein